MVPLSVLDLVPLGSGRTSADALRDAGELARAVDRLGYARLWYAEHHNMPGITTTTPEILIAHVAPLTTRIRLGAGGVMLPNHAPLKVAESYRLLEALHPGRIDLGLGRAPGTDPRTALALRRTLNGDVDGFPEDVVELMGYFGQPRPGQRVHAIPGEGTEVEVWILGSSLFGASLAAELGLPFAFASHFAPDALLPALQIYRSRFKPSEQLAQSYAMVGVNIIAGETDAEARRLATTQQMAFTNLTRGARGLSRPPIDD